MADPTSDLGENVPDEELPLCDSCESRIATGPQHRVITWIDEGSVRSAHFCDESCRMAWDGEL